MRDLEYARNRGSAAQIAEHLSTCDADFVPALSARVDIGQYAEKIRSKATRFEAWSGGVLVGLVAAYLNDAEARIGYVTSVSVLQDWKGRGIGAQLMGQCIAHATASGMRQITLEVGRDNAPAIRMYERSGFRAGDEDPPFIRMHLMLEAVEPPALTPPKDGP
jgi:ribosomal protein S18 acetylase RimI-like enzyme